MTQYSKLPAFIILICIMGFGAAFTSGCNSVSYSYKHTFGDTCWGMGDTLDIPIDVNKGEFYRIRVNFKEDYAYQNLYLKLLYQLPGQEKMESFMLQDTILTPSGEWLADKEDGTYPLDFTIYRFHTDTTAIQSFRLIQFMREESLCGISSVGVIKE